MADEIDRSTSSLENLTSINLEAKFNARKAGKFDEQALADRIQLLMENNEGNPLNIEEVTALIKEFSESAGSEHLENLFTSASTLLFIVNLARKLDGEPPLSAEECAKIYAPAFEMQKHESFKFIVRDELAPIWERISDESVQSGINFINTKKNDDAFQDDDKLAKLTEGAQQAAYKVIDEYVLKATEVAQNITGKFDQLLSETDYLFLVGGLKEIVGSGIAMGVKQAFDED